MDNVRVYESRIRGVYNESVRVVRYEWCHWNTMR